jgi:archaellum component FlaF (FlaF/FlaG flagellin family)
VTLSGSTFYGFFYDANTPFQAVFGSVSATSGSATSKLSATLTGFDGPIVAYAANAGTLRITGNLTSDDGNINVVVNGQATYVGVSASTNGSVAVGAAGSEVRLSGSYVEGSIQMWLVPNA